MAEKTSASQVFGGCYLAEHGLAISPRGVLKACCNAMSSEITMESAESVLSYFTDSYYRGLLEDFKGQKFPFNCMVCKKSEVRGLKSQRQKHNKVSSYIPTSEPKFSIESLEFLEVNFSNLCNLSCSFCSSNNSSKWIDLDQKLVEEGLKSADFITPEVRSVRHVSSAQWNEIFKRAVNLKQVFIKGGEPFLDPQFPVFLESLAKHLGKRIELVIVTNGTVLPDPIMESLQSFKRLIITVSLDGVGETYRYVRGGEFKEVESNLKKITGIPGLYHCEVSYAICNLNLFNLRQFLDWYLSFVEQLKDSSSLIPEINFKRFVERPTYLSPWILPDELKIQAPEEIDRVIEIVKSIEGGHWVNQKCVEPLRSIKETIVSFSSKRRNAQLKIFNRFIEVFNTHRGFKFEFPKI